MALLHPPAAEADTAPAQQDTPRGTTGEKNKKNSSVKVRFLICGQKSDSFSLTDLNVLQPLIFFVFLFLFFLFLLLMFVVVLQ